MPSFWITLATMSWIALGILLNPFLTGLNAQLEAVLASEGFVAVGWLVWNLWQCRTSSDERSAVHTPRANSAAWLMLLGILAAWAFLYRWWWTNPRLVGDDLICLHDARDWATTQAALLKPFNEHLLPLSRSIAWLAVQTTTPKTLPTAFAAVTAVNYAIALAQIFLFARREWRGDFWGLLAASAFALSTVQHECIWWYSAAQALFSFNLILLALRILDPERPSIRRLWLATLTAAVAPFNFSLGLLVGPLACLWVFLRWPRFGRRLWLLPLGGTALALTIVYPLIAAGFTDEQYLLRGGRGVWRAFDPWLGAVFSVRAVVDQLLMYNLGFPPRVRSDWFHAGGFAVVSGAVACVVRRSRAPRSLLTPLAMIAFGYAMTLAFRTWVGYRVLLVWGARHELAPQLGVSLFLTGAAGNFRGRSESRGFKSLTLKQALMLVAFVFVLLRLHEFPTETPPDIYSQIAQQRESKH